MSQFVLYTYQFSPIQNRKNLFESELTDEELMNKNKRFFRRFSQWTLNIQDRISITTKE